MSIAYLNHEIEIADILNRNLLNIIECNSIPHIAHRAILEIYKSKFEFSNSLVMSNRQHPLLIYRNKIFIAMIYNI